MTIDFHCHTSYSFDSWMNPRDVLRVAKSRGLDGIAITDHETIRGAVHTEAINNDRYFTVIVGAEITTDVGDIIGLYLRHEIRSRAWQDVVKEIHDQGGLVYLPHPFRSHRLSEELLDSVDIVEIFNARTKPELNAPAMALAQKHGKPMAVGSDSHFQLEIAQCKNILPSGDIRAELLAGRVTHESNYSPNYVSSASEVVMRWKLRQYSRLPGACSHFAATYFGLK